MEFRHENALLRVYQADKALADDGREPDQFHLRYPGEGREIDHPRWNPSWAAPSEQTIDDLEEMGILRVEPHHNKTRSFGLTMLGRTKGKELAETGSTDQQSVISSAMRGNSGETDQERSIFVVHGHGRKDEVARFLQKATRTEPVVLSEIPGAGKTIIEKFEQFAGNASYAVVLLTADDVGAQKAKQYEDEVELPSDYVGVEYISFDDDWKLKLLAELGQAGFDVTAAAT